MLAMQLLREKSIDGKSKPPVSLDDQISSLGRNSSTEIILYSLEKISQQSEEIRQLIARLLDLFPQSKLIITEYKGFGGFAAVHRMWTAKKEKLEPTDRCFKFPLGKLTGVDWNYLERRIPAITNSPGCVRVNGVWQIHDLADDRELKIQDINYVHNFQNLIMILKDKNNPENNPRNIFRIIRSVAIELQRLHEEGCIHRDLCPANIVVSRNSDTVQINDFDISRQEFSERGENGAGKFNYMNLYKLFRKNRIIDRADDYYAIGVLLTELLFMHLQHLQISNTTKFAGQNDIILKLKKLHTTRRNMRKDRTAVRKHYQDIYGPICKELTDIIFDLIANDFDKQKTAFERLLSDEAAEMITNALPNRTFQELEDGFELDETFPPLQA